MQHQLQHHVCQLAVRAQQARALRYSGIKLRVPLFHGEDMGAIGLRGLRDLHLAGALPVE